jgi:hypothetical protein
MIQQIFLHRALVEPSDRAEPPRDGGPDAATGFQVAGETLNVGAPCLEEAEIGAQLDECGRTFPATQKCRFGAGRGKRSGRDHAPGLGNYPQASP